MLVEVVCDLPGSSRKIVESSRLKTGRFSSGWTFLTTFRSEGNPGKSKIRVDVDVEVNSMLVSSEIQKLDLRILQGNPLVTKDVMTSCYEKD